MNKDYENLKEITDLCKEELENNNQDTTAVLDIKDLKSLNNILLDYKRLLNENEELNKRNTFLIKQYNDVFNTLLKEIDHANEMNQKNESLKADLHGANSKINEYIDILKDFISKQKIREKIKKYKSKDYIRMQLIKKHDKEALKIVSVLEELLGEKVND